jgi:hypothetical protein
LSKYSENKYILENSLKKPKPIKRKQLKIESFNTDTGLYFCHVNNMDLVLIDEIIKRPNVLELRSNFKLDYMQLLDIGYTDMAYADHLAKLLEGDTIDYDTEYGNMLIDALYDEEDLEE